MPETIRKPPILDERKKRRKIYNSAKELIRFTEELNRNGNVSDLTCNDISDDESDFKDFLNGNDSDDSLPEKKTKKKAKSPDIENSDDNKIKKTKLKPGKKKQTKEETKKVPKIKVKLKEAKDTSKKLKFPRNTFSVEDVGAESNVLTITPRKRKALSSWQIHDLEVDSEAYKKITVPKIIKLQMKGSSPLIEERKTQKIREETPVQKLTPIKLTASFWDKAKEKAFRKKNSRNSSLLLVSA